MISICIINIIMIKIIVNETPALDHDNILKYIGLILGFKIIFYLLKSVYLLKY